jgi:hypothetical protein
MNERKKERPKEEKRKKADEVAEKSPQQQL